MRVAAGGRWQLSSQLNRRLVEAYDDPASRSWFRLFKRMDSDGNGLVSLDEMRWLLRSELGMSAKEAPDAQVWNTALPSPLLSSLCT